MGNVDIRDSVATSMPVHVRAKMDNSWHPLHTSLWVYNKLALPNMILTCLGNRVETAHSVESRPPFLDQKLAEYVNALPPC